ncbi:MAG TPA: hypothetical protein VH253_00620 [Phycisphaerae bacterium]|nr:hypothetical protein [Phycisphaerae bacterium]
MTSKRPLALLLLACTVSAARAQSTAPATQPALEPDSSGWIVLFRSDDSNLWNTDAGKRLQKNGYAASLDRLPGDIRYIRITRMDTGESIIAEAPRDALIKSAVIPNALVLQTGIQTFSDDGGAHKLLGIGAYGMLAVKGQPYVWKTSSVAIETGYGGWGIGKTAGGGQAWSWNGQPIGKTVFEIAVKNADLSLPEKKDLLTAGSITVTSATWGKGAKAVDVTDIVKDQIKPGVLRFSADEAILGTGGAAAKGRTLHVTAIVNGETVERQVAEGRMFQLMAPPLKTGEAVADLGAAGPSKKIASAPPKLDSSGWLALFRGNDPQLWNTSAGNPDLASGFAGALDKVPADILYLRIKRMDTGDAVIIPMNRKFLTDDIQIDHAIEWVGAQKTWKHQGKNTPFLGIADEALLSEKSGEPFLLPLKDSPDHGFSGWGFGKDVGKDEVQTQWEGAPLPASTTLEIAFKSTPLTSAERAQVLIPGQLDVLQARWGHGMQQLDAAKKLRSLVHAGELSFTVNTDLGPDPDPKTKKQLVLTYRLNGVAFTHTYLDGEHVALLAPPLKGGDAGARGKIPLRDELLILMDAHLYTDALAGLDKLLALDNDLAGGADRHELLLMKAECLLQGKDRQLTLAAYNAVEREAATPDGAADAIAMAYLLQHSTADIYKPATGPGINLLDLSARKSAYEALWTEQKAAMDKTVSAALSSGVPDLVAAANSLKIARAAEIVATGNADEVRKQRLALAKRTEKLIHDELQKEIDDTESIYAKGMQEIHNVDTGQTWRAGLSIDQKRRLDQITAASNQIITLLVQVVQTFDDVEDFRPLGKSAEKIHARAIEVNNYRYR